MDYLVDLPTYQPPGLPAAAAAYAMDNEIVVVDNDDGKNRHGFPRGYHFVPKRIELVRLLDDKLAGHPLPYPLYNIFHDVRILDFHPAQLHEAYRAHEEAGFIYFFSNRVFPMQRGDRARPVRGTMDGGHWKASGGGKAVSTKKRGGVKVGFELTMVFYEKKKPGQGEGDKTDWGMHEYTKIIGPEKEKKVKVTDLALYRLYKVKGGKKSEEKKEKSGKEKQKSRKEKPKSEEKKKKKASRRGLQKLEELPSQSPTDGWPSMASTSQAQAQASVGQPHVFYHQYAYGAAASASAPGPSSWVNPPGQQHAGCMGLTGSPPVPLMAPSVQETPVSYSPQQQATASVSLQQEAVNHYDLADWDNMLTEPSLLAPSSVSGTAAVAHDLLPTSQQQDAKYPGPADSNEFPLKMLPPSPLQAPEAQAGCLEDEFMLWSEMQPAVSSCWFPMLDGDDLPMLTDKETELYACTLDELLAPMTDEAAMSIEEPDTNHQVQSKQEKSVGAN